MIQDCLHNLISNSLNNLVIDDKDTGISYQHTETCSTFNCLDILVDDFIKNPNDTNFERIMTASDSLNKLYKVDNLNKLSQLTHCMSGCSRMSFKWIDSSDIVKLILIDGSEIPLHKPVNTKYVRFLKITDKQFSHPIIIDGNYPSNYLQSWVIEAENYIFFDKSQCISQSDCLNDMDGYVHLQYYEQEFQSGNKDLSNYPAIQHVKKLSDDEYTAYIPALGELYYLDVYQSIINLLLHLSGFSFQFSSLIKDGFHRLSTVILQFIHYVIISLKEKQKEV